MVLGWPFQKIKDAKPVEHLCGSVSWAQAVGCIIDPSNQGIMLCLDPVCSSQGRLMKIFLSPNLFQISSAKDMFFSVECI